VHWWGALVDDDSTAFLHEAPILVPTPVAGDMFSEKAGARVCCAQQTYATYRRVRVPAGYTCTE
jgi:hypothetical protein